MKKRLCRQWKKILERLRIWLGAGRRDRKDKSDRKIQASKEQQLSQEELFLQVWTQALTEKAEVFNGLYGGLRRIQAGTAKKKEKIIGEWWNRARYQWEESPLEEISRKVLEPLRESGTEEEYRRWTELLLRAAEAAGIMQDAPGEAVLDELTANAYTEWEGKQLYLGDHVEILFPAWYQNGRVVEQGNCRSLETEEG